MPGGGIHGANHIKTSAKLFSLVSEIKSKRQRLGLELTYKLWRALKHLILNLTSIGFFKS